MLDPARKGAKLADQTLPRAERRRLPPRRAQRRLVMVSRASNPESPRVIPHRKRRECLLRPRRRACVTSPLAWLEKRIENAEPNADTLRAIAWGIGRRIAAGHLDGGEAREKLWPLTEQVAELGFDEFDQAVEDGIARGFDPGPLLADLDCSRYPMTDFGIAERFRDRYGDEFRFTTAKGWLGWDGRRWKVLDQDKDTPPAEVIAAAFETIRSIQREARRVADTGIKHRLITIGKQQDLDLEDPNLHALDYWMAVGKQWKLFSTVLAGWGRQSEQSGKPGAIAALARRWLTVPIEDFDCEQMAVNVMNGTLRFVVEQLPDGGNKVAVSLASIAARI
jgi:putative DNA primase/helicase